jgi:hypothetical protein
VIPFVNKLFLKFGINCCLVPLDETMKLIIRCDAYADYITSTLESGQIAYYNENTNRVEVGMKH